MRRLCRIVSACMAIFCLSGSTAVAAGHLNAYALQGDFICVSCHEPLNQVNSPEAIAEKETLGALVNQGLGYNQIKTEMVSDYGQDVLARPPAKGINLLVYILPPLVLVGGLGLLAYNLPRWRTRARLQAAAGAGPTGPPPTHADAERLDRELAEFDR
jgi:cytochrome c-type biogenesis protein CcmH/NrfF